MEDEICPYATFHLLGFREEMDPSKAMNFQTFPHQNGGHVAGPGGPGHAGTIGPVGPNHPGHPIHSRSGSQSMVSEAVAGRSSANFVLFINTTYHLQPRQNRYARKNSQGGQSSIYTPAPEYDDPANCAEEDQYVSATRAFFGVYTFHVVFTDYSLFLRPEHQRRYTRVNSQGGSLYGGPGPEYDDPANCAPEEDQYGSQYGAPYGGPYDHYGSRGSVGRRSVGECDWLMAVAVWSMSVCLTIHDHSRIHAQHADERLTWAATTAATQPRHQQLIVQRLEGEQRDLRGWVRSWSWTARQLWR